jgi:hypothetical protein
MQSLPLCFSCVTCMDASRRGLSNGQSRQSSQSAQEHQLHTRISNMLKLSRTISKYLKIVSVDFLCYTMFPIIMPDVTNMNMAKQLHAVLHFIVGYFTMFSASRLHRAEWWLMNDKLKSILEDVVMTQLWYYPSTCLEGWGKQQKKNQSGWPVYWPQFEQGISWT